MCPPAPFLIPGLAPNLLAAAADVADASRCAVTELADVDRIVVLAEAARWRRLAPGTRLSGAAFGRSDLPSVPPVTLPGAPTTRSAVASPPAVVAAYLLTGGGLREPAEVAELAPGDAERAAELLAALPGTVGVLAMADGAAAHGPNAPLAQDERAELVDDRLAAALVAGNPAALAAATDHRELLSSVGVAAGEVFRVLARLPAPHTAELLARDAPFGVGYLVATWSYRTEGR